MKVSALLLVPTLLLGIVLGYALGGDGGARPAPVRPEPKPRSAIADVGVVHERRITAETVVVTNVVSVTNRFGPGPGGMRGDPRKFFEEMKKNDPERFAQMTNRMAQWRQRRQERTRSRLEFLASIDTSRMSAKARETHDGLMELMQKREELEAKMGDESLSEDERHSLMDEMRELSHEMRKLNDAERKNLLGETAKALGFEGEDAAEIVSTVGDIVDATSDGGMRGGPPPGPPPGQQAPAGR